MTEMIGSHDVSLMIELRLVWLMMSSLLSIV
jgi:hypothetical protein